jgi:hypothetical protein
MALRAVLALKILRRCHGDGQSARTLLTVEHQGVGQRASVDGLAQSARDGSLSDDVLKIHYLEIIV